MTRVAETRKAATSQEIKVNCGRDSTSVSRQTAAHRRQLHEDGGCGHSHSQTPVEAIPIFTPHRCLMGKFSQRPLAGVVEKLERGKGDEKRKSK